MYIDSKLFRERVYIIYISWTRVGGGDGGSEIGGEKERGAGGGGGIYTHIYSVTLSR